MAPQALTLLVHQVLQPLAVVDAATAVVVVDAATSYSFKLVGPPDITLFRGIWGKIKWQL